MALSLRIEDLEIIGSTIIPEPGALPIRLSPVLRRRGAEQDLYLLAGRSADEPQAISASWLEEEEADGGVVRFVEPMADRPMAVARHLR